MKTHKFYAIFIISILMLALSACNKVNDAINVNVPLQMAEVDFTIPPMGVGEHDLATSTVYVHVDSILKAFNASAAVNNIKSVKIKSCTISLLDDTVHPDDNFTSLTSFNVAMSSNNKTDWSTVAILENTVIDPYFVNLPVDDKLELKDYFKGTTFLFRMHGKLKKAFLNDVKCRANIKFDIEAGL